MRAVVQRVSRASVAVDEQIVGQIGHGLLVLVAARDGDTEKDVSYIADKIAHLRIFEDNGGKMNLSVMDVGGAVLAVSQFTLYGDCRKGRRPSFVHAMRPESAFQLFDTFVARVRMQGLVVETGTFQAHMAVSLVNDGPVTLLIDSQKEF